MFFLRFFYAKALYILFPLVFAIVLLRWRLRRPIIFRYSLASVLYSSNVMHSHLSRTIFFLLRFISLMLLAFLIAKPQLVDERSKVKVEGIDIVLVLDVSGSMQLSDFEDDNRSRVEVAKDEAVRFIKKRQNDAIGLVIFAQDALSRAPLTMDKLLLKEIVQDLKIGIINPDGTKLATAIVTAVNRLKNSKAKSKVMILLTDGEPSEDDLDSSVAIEVAKKFGIKIYTVGIGSKEDRVGYDIFGRMLRVRVNKELLQTIARETGGQFFMASDARDMRSIYNTIDKLETTKMEVPIFSKYYDIFMPFIFVLIGLLLFELILSIFVWFGI